MEKIEQTIASDYIQLSKDNYDENELLKPSKDLLNQSIKWMFNNLQKAFMFGIIIPFPKILEGPGDGSVDFYWNGEKKLLLNIADDGVTTYYGYIHGTNNEIKG